MLPGRRDDKGALFVTALVPGPASTLLGGIAHSAAGVIHIAEVDSSKFVNGVMVTDLGQLCVGPPPIARFANGLPQTASGRLVIQLNVAPFPGDSYVGGIRVGPNGGIYVINTTPEEPAGFSNGFSNGFDAKV